MTHTKNKSHLAAIKFVEEVAEMGYFATQNGAEELLKRLDDLTDKARRIRKGFKGKK